MNREETEYNQTVIKGECMRGVALNKEALTVFGYLMPEHYQRQIIEGEAEGIGFLDDLRENEIIGTAVMREWNGWEELMWLSLDGLYRRGDFGVQILEFCSGLITGGSGRSGIFADFPQGSGHLQEIFTQAGFSVKPSGSSFVTTLREVLEKPLFHQNRLTHAMQRVAALASLNTQARRELIYELNEIDDLPLPAAPTLEKYDANVSFIHYDKNEKPDTLLLVAAYGSRLTLECAWTKNPAAFLGVLQAAIKAAVEKYPADMQVDIPTITEESEKLAKRLLDDTGECKMLQARKLF